MTDEKTVLLSKTAEEISGLLIECRSFVGKQIFGFLNDGKEFFEMTSLSLKLRQQLEDNFIANPVKILKKYVGKSGTVKYLFRLIDDNLIEGVYMPHDYGNTLCLSTQVGCRMGCTFCASGIDGLKRNLTAAEMLGQVIAVNRDMGGTAKNRIVNKLVLMGSGEPFDNYDNVCAFLKAVTDIDGLNISERSISVSTSGLCDKIKAFADSGFKVTLSISLHAPFDDMRSRLMPVNKAYGIDKLIAAAKYYFERTGRRVIFEYTLIKGENDSDECVRQLAKILSGFPSHVNVIKLNKVDGKDKEVPSEKDVDLFLKKLERAGVSATLRRSLGNDVEGACGQLRRRYLSEEDV